MRGGHQDRGHGLGDPGARDGDREAAAVAADPAEEAGDELESGPPARDRNSDVGVVEAEHGDGPGQDQGDQRHADPQGDQEDQHHQHG